jgi:hypothetical protein
MDVKVFLLSLDCLQNLKNILSYIVSSCETSDFSSTSSSELELELELEPELEDLAEVEEEEEELEDCEAADTPSDLRENLMIPLS